MGEESRTQRDLPMVTQQVEREDSNQPCLSPFCSQRLFPQDPRKGALGHLGFPSTKSVSLSLAVEEKGLFSQC